ncbi:MAG: HlyD family type I secretion periplasmic adaptor subunit [Pseudomonadota bacterium]
MNTFWSMLRLPFMMALVAGIAFFGGLLVFSSYAPMATGAVATGELVHLSQRLPIGHQQGGRIAEVLVRDGDRVEAGAALMLLEDPELERQVTVLRQRAHEASVTVARYDALIEERDELVVDGSAPEDVLRRHQSLLAREREAHTQRLLLLEERIALKQAEIEGLADVKQSKEREVKEVSDQVELLEELERRGAAPRMRVLEMRRQRYDIDTDLSEITLQLQRARLELNDARVQYANERADAFRRYESERSASVAELDEHQTSLVALEDSLERLVLRAPQAGHVIDLRFRGPGAILEPNAEAVALVPEGEVFIIQAMLSPMDVDRVQIGQTADIAFSHLPSRYATRLHATLEQIDAGRTDDETGSFYRAWLTLSDESLEFARENGGIISGAPVEVRINTGERSLASYIIEPLSGFWFKGLRES